MLVFEIAGVKYHAENFIAAQVQAGDIVDLVPEPKNKYDPNAIKVMKTGFHIGYVPKMFTFDVHAVLERGSATAKVDSAWMVGCVIAVDDNDSVTTF
jgi:hypothetical protein